MNQESDLIYGCTRGLKTRAPSSSIYIKQV